MRYRKYISVSTLIKHSSTCLLLAALAQAAVAETYSADGVGYAKDKSQAYPVTDGHVVLMSASDYYDFKGNEVDNPMNGLSGPCFGEVTIEGASTAGDGYCTWTDGGGNTVLIRWESTGVDDEGSNIGAWNIVGGTGKWQGSTGAGNYNYTTEEGSDEGRNRVTGSVTLNN